MPPPTGVVSGPLMPMRYSRNVSTVSSGSQSPVASNAFSPGEHLLPRDRLAVLGRGGVEHELRGGPDVDAGAVALDERDDRLVGDVRARRRRQRDLLGHRAILSSSSVCACSSGVRSGGRSGERDHEQRDDEDDRDRRRSWPRARAAANGLGRSGPTPASHPARRAARGGPRRRRAAHAGTPSGATARDAQLRRSRSPRSALRGLDGVAEQHRDRRGPDAADARRDPAGDLLARARRRRAAACGPRSARRRPRRPRPA